ncbi:hypothetical protein PHYSODRAFT_318945 [Phytophthora sojae]|uniref:Glycosyltransferase family 28 N-terminal domain-containing protein n=1 Tax=Phytophthora sojae (strain P6497) TaxID=1094619 RepID=G5A5B7_PHYSP|nr:hypothetical protein PHYSODRAFT_318945 [Phytophthora sojae]EGZ09302.1 hypothetical protein PHYSODRAFT_318945 [Phytophthora sojae]|eukprot:XP_009535935.1 hypothetical protein PHYSODRAFT_318945 [Phytophthora sojae]
MRICIIIVGTRGDVQPFLAIAQRLQRDGHRVRLATHAVYRDFVMDHGVEFYPLGGDPKELAAYMVKTGGHLIPTKIETLTKDVPRNKEMINEIVHSTWPAVSAADPNGGGPGLSSPTPVSYGHIHVAERLGVPLHIMFPQPWVPTRASPHPLANMPYTDELKKTNYLSYKMVDLLMWQGTEGLINEFRTKVLKLRKIRNGDGGRDLLLDLRIPHAFMWSLELVPKPADWGDLYDVIGTVTLSGGPSSSYTPSPELEAFLSRDGGPIFVGFGSMVLADPMATTKMIVQAAQQARVRVLIQSSWSDMAGDLDIPDNVFFIGNCPHDWIMPRVSHLIVPFFGDQPFWGHAVVKAGVGVEPCPILKLTTEKLREAFEGLMNPTLRAKALQVRNAMRREDGAGEAVRSFYRHLPTQDMFCDLDHERIATRWSVRDRLKLCDRCAFIVGERPENAGKKLVSYHCVDYSARVFWHEIAGASSAVFRQPVKGFKRSGYTGGVVGGVAGLAQAYIVFYTRALLGCALLVDHVIAGHINSHRLEGQRKRSSLLSRHMMATLGAQRGLADTYCSSNGSDSAGILLLPCKHECKSEGAMALHSVFLKSSGSVDLAIDTPNEEADYIDKDTIAQLQALRTSVNIKCSIPTMNVCLTAMGSWDNGIKQFAAIGLELSKHGHRVRLAANGGFRSKILALGLEFYPLDGAPNSIQDVMQLIHDAQLIHDDAEPGRSSLETLQAFRELIYSLWPAAYGSDPHGNGPNKPGEHFRADALLWHPMLLGHVHVAQRLGIPLQCASLDPLSPTFEFPHVLSSKLLSHGAVDAALNHGSIQAIMTQFRSFIGLSTRLDRPDSLAQWEVPHVYLYNPALLPKPLDWTEEITVAGHVTLKDDHGHPDIPRALTEFAFSKAGPPVIYFGVSARSLAVSEVEDLVRKVDQAAQRLHLRVIIQPDVLAEGLAVGKPVAICGSHPSQLFTARLCQRVGVGIASIDPKTCTAESLVESFQQLLLPAIRDKAQALARTFDPSRALDVAVGSFYSNLPMAAMVCDVDPTKLARVFDSHHNLKLSLEAYLAMQPVRDESKGFVPYKPLEYDGFCPPVFSIRGNPGEIPRDAKPPRGLDGVNLADERRSSEQSQRSSESSSGGVVARVVDTEVFWTSKEEEEAERKSTNAAYERLVKPRGLRKRDKLAHMFGGKPKHGEHLTAR